jgi:hypothetical protein
MCKRSLSSRGASWLLLGAVVFLSACKGSDQPQVEQLTKAQAVTKQALDDQMRTRLRTTQSDR